MSVARTAAITAIGMILSGQAVAAGDVSRYRTYVLESSLQSVIVASGARVADVSTVHERPAMIQEVEWRAPYMAGSEPDPVEAITFSFYDATLYQIVVRYSRERTEGLTTDDIIDALSASYGLPVLTSVATGTNGAAAKPSSTTVLAHWDDAVSAVTLLRDAYAPEYRLILVSKALSIRARGAIREALRLDALEAPRREQDQRNKEVANAGAALEKKRAINKAAFRP